MGRKIPGAALLAAAALAAALPCEAAYVRGDLVWKCDFTPEEAARCGVAGLRFDESGRGAEYDPRGGAAGDGALHFRSPSQDYEVKIPVRPDLSPYFPQTSAARRQSAHFPGEACRFRPLQRERHLSGMAVRRRLLPGTA